MDATSPATVIDRTAGVGGELVLRRAGDDYEIISNGVFLMDTRNGASERLLVRAATETLDGPFRIAIGGLGAGFSLAEALRLPGTAHVTVIEREPAVVAWHATVLRPWSEGGLDDPRVTVARTDLLDWIADPRHDAQGGTFDALCLDIDNGPDWTVTPGNARLYSGTGLDRLTRLLTPRGVLAVWSAGDAPAFEALLRDRFTDVQARRVPAPRGEPDIVYLARTPRPRRSTNPGRPVL